MKNRLIGVLAAIALIICSLAGNQAIATPGVSAPVLCAVSNPPEPGQPVASAQIRNALALLGRCPVNPGDVFTDGVLQNPATTFNGSSFQVTIPALNWYANGLGGYAFTATITVPSSTTSYEWIDSNTWLYTNTTINSPPTTTSVLAYTIVANGSGVTGVANPPYAGLVLPGTLTLSPLASGQCLQTSTNGLIVGTGGGCTSAISTPIPIALGGTATSAPSPQATATSCGAPVTRTGSFPSQVIQVPVCPTSSPQITPSPVASTCIGVSGTYAYTIGYTCSTPGPQATPSPTASTGVGIGGSWPYTIGGFAIYLATTSNTSIATGGTGSTWIQYGCGTGSINCTGAGVLGITTGTSAGVNGEWLATVTFYSTVGSALTAETVDLCVSASPNPTTVDASTGANTACSGTTGQTGTKVMGGPTWGNVSNTSGGQNQMLQGRFIVPNSTTQNFYCYGEGSTTNSATVYGYCTVRVEPY